MAATWSLFKKIAGKKYDEIKESRDRPMSERIDKDFPLGIRLKGIVEIPEVDFILGGNDLKIKHPGESNVVVSYGTFPVGESSVKRFYLDARDQPYILQIVTDAKNLIEECKLFMPYDEIFPQDWGFWLAEADGLIGYSEFQTKDGTQYLRVWDNPDQENVVQEDDQGNRITRIPPFQFTETICLDAYGEQTEKVNYDSMLYGRRVNDNSDEYLLVSAVEAEDGASVQIMVGIELQPASIKVI
jgi:hypothetical protein